MMGGKNQVIKPVEYGTLQFVGMTYNWYELPG